MTLAGKILRQLLTHVCGRASVVYARSRPRGGANPACVNFFGKHEVRKRPRRRQNNGELTKRGFHTVVVHSQLHLLYVAHKVASSITYNNTGRANGKA